MLLKRKNNVQCMSTLLELVLQKRKCHQKEKKDTTYFNVCLVNLRVTNKKTHQEKHHNDFFVYSKMYYLNLIIIQPIVYIKLDRVN